MKLDKISICIIVLALLFIGVGLYTVATEPDFEGEGFVLAGSSAAIAGFLLYKLSNRRPGQ